MATTSPPRLDSPTRSGPAEPRHLVLPDGIVSTGWPAVKGVCAEVGIGFDPWQESLNRPMLAKDADGLYAADTIVMSICRQSGKTYDVGGVTFADSIIHPGTTTVWTAHRFKVARESFNELRALASSPQMAPHVDPDEITTAAGNEMIPFRNGSRIVFAARERGAVRGFTKVRRLVIDEAQILTEMAMSDLVPTTNQAWNPQIVLMGTPPKPSDPGEVFTALRLAALEGSAEGLLYCEYSASPDCDTDDWDAVAEANPSFPKRTGRRAVLRLRKLLTNEDDYRREGLGIWHTADQRHVIDLDLWAELADPRPPKLSEVALAVDVTPDRSTSTVAVAGLRPDGRRHVEVLVNDRGTSWVVDRVQSLLAKRPGEDIDVVLDPSGPANTLTPDFEAAGVTVVPVTNREMGQACGAFFDAVTDRKDVTHANQPGLNSALGAAKKRPIGDAWGWHRKDVTTDISPLVAVTLALFGHDRSKGRKPKRTGKAAFY
jgi:hypothetical protein